MSLSEKRKEEMGNALLEGTEAIQYLSSVKVPKELNLWGNVFLGYLASANLIQHSKTLNRWTKIIAFTSIALIVFSIAQIIMVILLR